MILPGLVYIRRCLSAISSSKLAVCISDVNKTFFVKTKTKTSIFFQDQDQGWLLLRLLTTGWRQPTNLRLAKQLKSVSH